MAFNSVDPTCTTGFSFKFLNLIAFFHFLESLCQPGLCQNGGTCFVLPIGVYICKCIPGYTGRNCSSKSEFFKKEKNGTNSND